MNRCIASFFIATFLALVPVVHADTRLTNCDLWVDPSGLPHIRGGDESEAMACLGYLHGRDRAWQMDFFKRIAQGRKAEVLGFKELTSDFRMRLLGLRERAEVIYHGMESSEKALLEVYAKGVNAGMATPEARNSYEFRELGYVIEPWHAEDTVLLILLQSFDQTRKSFIHDLTEADLLKKGYREEALALFRPDGLPWDVSILKAGEFPSTPAPASAAVAGPSDEGLQGEGSNNWVLNASRSRTGAALLANDPHLSLKHPPFWYWSHVSGGELDVIGASFPGIPVIVSGANRHVSWGLTNAYLDVADVNYIPEEDLKSAVSVRPVIWFRVFWKLQLPFFFKTFQRTPQNWPVLPLEAPAGKAMIVRWSAFDLKPSEVSAFHRIMRAKSAREMDQLLAQVGIPTWNFVFADDQGNIGYRAVGRIPKRTEAPAFGIPEARLAELKPWELLTTDEMPHVLIPARSKDRGYVVTANNRQWPAQAPLHGGRAYSPGFRAFRIEELLAKTEHHDLESNRAIQCDVQAVDARFLVPKLLEAFAGRASDHLLSAALTQLQGWDFQATKDCRACAIFRRWMDRIEAETGMDESALYRSLSAGVSPAFSATLEHNLRSALGDLKVDPKHPEFPRWGDIHLAPFGHLAENGKFETHPLSTPGDRHSVNPGTPAWNPQEGRYDHVSGASQRLIVEMTQPPSVYAVLAGSNLDQERRSLSDPSGPWMQWADCRLEKKAFPVNWAQIPSAKIAF